MPGPDGIPYKAWRELGETGVDILWEVMKELKQDGAQDKMDEAYEGEHEFNASIMVCLPKVPIGMSEEGEDVYDAASTRPLSIVNTDNRILASAARTRWDSIYAQWISKMQK